MEYFIYLALGSIAGLVSGLFGVGGGTVIVPILLLSFAAQDISSSVATHLAIATSLACIAVSSISSIFTHYQKGAIDLGLIKFFVPGIIVGTLLGTSFFIAIEGMLLQFLLGTFLTIIGLQMVIYRSVTGAATLPYKGWLATLGVAVGGMSALFGVGGGMFTTPLLTYFGVQIHRAIGVAAVGGFFIALTASVINGSRDLGSSAMPDMVIGYIFIPAWIGIIITSMPFARLGAKLAHRANEQQLKQVFGGFLFLLGIWFVWRNAGSYLILAAN